MVEQLLQPVAQFFRESAGPCPVNEADVDKIAQMRAVGGPDLAQDGPALAHDLGDAEAAAELHKLPARDDALAAPNPPPSVEFS